MSIPDADELFAHMLEATNQASVYIDGMTREDIFADKRTQQGVTRNLIILGEAATKLMDRHPDVIENFPEIAWRAMRGMRNRIAHGYYEIDLDVVWETVSTALPALSRQLVGIR